MKPCLLNKKLKEVGSWFECIIQKFTILDNSVGPHFSHYFLICSVTGWKKN